MQSLASGECVLHVFFGLLAGRVEVQLELLERQQRTAAQGGGERGAAGVGDLVGTDVKERERLELADPASFSNS